jgi:L-threonylcarbamoyladenylate synthase
LTELVSIERDGAAAARVALERCVAAGGIAVFPSDGLYGLACDPLDRAAVERIHRLKGRDEGKSSAVMYFSPLAMRELLAGMGERTRAVAAELLPGRVTLVVANPERRYPLASREDPERLGLRLIEGPLAGARTPVLQTSANPSGEAPPASFEDVQPAIADGADLAIDGGALTGEPSTVIDIAELDAGGGWKVLREGAIGRAELERRLAPLLMA